MIAEGHVLFHPGEKVTTRREKVTIPFVQGTRNKKLPSPAVAA